MLLFIASNCSLFQNSYRNKNMSEGAKNLFEKLSSTFKKDMPFNDENEITVERCVKFRGTLSHFKKGLPMSNLECGTRYL